jgi:hypothetical protein
MKVHSVLLACRCTAPSQTNCIAFRHAIWFNADVMLHNPAAYPAAPLRALLKTDCWHHILAVGLLMPKQAELLERLCVRWQRPLTASESRWAVCFAHLVAFTRRHGHCQVLSVHSVPQGCKPTTSRHKPHGRQSSDQALHSQQLWCACVERLDAQGFERRCPRTSGCWPTGWHTKWRCGGAACCRQRGRRSCGRWGPC